MQLKNLSQVRSWNAVHSFEDISVGMHSIRLNPDSKDQNLHETSIESQFPTKQRPIQRRSYL